MEGITSFEEIYKLIEIDDELDNRYDEDNFEIEDAGEMLTTLPENNNVANTNDILMEEPPDSQQEYNQNTEVLDLGSLK